MWTGTSIKAIAMVTLIVAARGFYPPAGGFAARVPTIKRALGHIGRPQLAGSALTAFQAGGLTSGHPAARKNTTKQTLTSTARLAGSAAFVSPRSTSGANMSPCQGAHET